MGHYDELFRQNRMMMEEEVETSLDVKGMVFYDGYNILSEIAADEPFQSCVIQELKDGYLIYVGDYSYKGNDVEWMRFLAQCRRESIEYIYIY